MKFSEALAALEEGRPITRNGSRFSRIRRVDPRSEPNIDGPARVFVIVNASDRFMSNFGEFEDEAEAKAALKAARTTLTKEYSAFDKAQEAWDNAEPQERENLTPGISPSFPVGFYEGAKVQERPASRANRINVPYLVGLTRTGETEPVVLTGSDLFATDWSIA